MIEVLDGCVLWGRDAWAAQNRPDLAHSAGAAEWRGRVEQAKGQGIALAGGLAMPFPSAPDRDFAAANRAVLDATAPEGPAPELAPVLAVRPGDPRSLDDLDAALATRRPVGIKLWPYMGGFDLAALSADAALMDRLETHRLMVLMHVGNGREGVSRPAFPPVSASPADALAVARDLPPVPVLIAHVARLCEATLAGLADTPTVVLDLSGLGSLGRWREGGRDGLPAEGGERLAALGAAGALKALIGDFGLGGRLLFGTTWPFCTWWGADLAREVAMIGESVGETALREAILGGTLRRLLEARRAVADAGREVAAP